MANIDDKTPDSPEDQIKKLQKENNRLQRIIKRHETQLQHLDKMASANEKTNIALYKELEVLQQQAEAQAREAQIEAALERVRSRSLAMHHTAELQSVIHSVHQELLQLNLSISGGSFIAINSEIDSEIHCWGSGGTADTSDEVHIPRFNKPFYTHLLKGIKSGPGFFTEEFTQEEKIEFFNFLFQHEPWSKLSEKKKNETLSAPGGYTRSCVVSKHTSIFIINHFGEKFSEAENDILKRFGKVFEQAYTRFLDIQQAEARAREAEQQASLDRVRAEIASMRTTGDLQRITPLIWRELTTLGVPFFRCGVFIIDEATEQAHVFLSTPAGEAVAALHLKFDRAPIIAAAVQNWRQQQVYREEWNREQFIAWTQSILMQGLIDSPEKYQAGGEAPEKLVLHFMPFTQGMLYIGSSVALSDDEIAIGQALAQAFGVAYARYEDFQRLEAAKAQVEAALENLKKTQGQLVQAEKMASLGQLTAGIAHEIKNPLNFVNNFAALSVDLAKELREEIVKRKTKNVNGDDFADVEEILAMLEQNAEKINHHGKRADGIVYAMMQHARGGKGERQPTDVNKLVEEYVNLSYHGMRAKVPDFNVSIEQDFGELDGKIEMVPQDIGRVLLNLLSNAFDAVRERAQSGDGEYSASVTVSTRTVDGAVEIRVRDNGGGIPDEVRGKIFEPFFTTKPAGSGTGLGLSLSFDIVTQGHGGTLTVESTQGEGATFVVRLPVKGSATL